MDVLCDATLDRLPPSVARPAYDRHSVAIGIVHLGLGAFHRAHMAAYVDACLADDQSWGICGVSLRSTSTREALAPQDGLYTLAVDSEAGLEARVVGALKEVLVAPDDPERLSDRLANPETRLVSLTITEKGYGYDAESGGLDVNHPDIAHDLGDPDFPRSAVGWIVHGLERRWHAGIPAFTVLSCDNLPENGALIRRLILAMAQRRSADLEAWLGESLACPSSMVDRIVPATTDAGRGRVSEALGLEDAWPVITEPFSQFVVEDRFALGRPAWEQGGVTMVDDVAPFEHMKLRMLNGSHSTLAYLGCLGGYETVADTMVDPAFKAMINAMMRDEIAPTLTMPAGIDLDAYREALIDRFANPALLHRTAQIAMDGSQKIPQRLLGIIRDRLAVCQPFKRLALGVAAWIAYASGATGQKPDPLQDPLADLIQARSDATDGSATELVEAFLELEQVFGADLRQSDLFREQATSALEQLLTSGARKVIAATSLL